MLLLTKWYRKDAVWFSVGWIILYVVGFGNADSLSEQIGIPKLLTVVLGLAMAVVLLSFIGKNHLEQELGMIRPGQKAKAYLYYAPLLIMVSVNFWQKPVFDTPLFETVLFIISMALVALLEEVIFRGLMFGSLRKISLTAAYLVSSLAFGAGHAVNLLMGAPVPDTLLQLLYASAAGFCFTALCDVSGSLLPCIAVHALVNACSIFAPEHTLPMQLLTAAATTVTSLLYGGWLLKQKYRLPVINKEEHPW